jgi:hypothetical protein
VREYGRIYERDPQRSPCREPGYAVKTRLCREPKTEIDR